MAKKPGTRQVFPFPDAQFAVAINALCDQLMTLRVRASDRLQPDKDLIVHLDSAQLALGRALDAALTVKKPYPTITVKKL